MNTSIAQLESACKTESKSSRFGSAFLSSRFKSTFFSRRQKPVNVDDVTLTGPLAPGEHTQDVEASTSRLIGVGHLSSGIEVSGEARADGPASYAGHDRQQRPVSATSRWRFAIRNVVAERRRARQAAAVATRDGSRSKKCRFDGLDAMDLELPTHTGRAKGQQRGLTYQYTERDASDGGSERRVGMSSLRWHSMSQKGTRKQHALLAEAKANRGRLFRTEQQVRFGPSVGEQPALNQGYRELQNMAVS